MKNIQVLERAVRLLELVAAAQDTPVQPGGLAAAAGLKTPTAMRIITTLCDLGYLRSCGRRQGYVLGDSARLLSVGGSSADALLIAAELPMSKFFDKFNEYLMLSDVSGSDRRRRRELTPNGPLQVAPLPERASLLADLSGRMLLAQLPGGRRRTVCNPTAVLRYWPEAADGISARLAVLERRGYGVASDAELIRLAVPVRAPFGSPGVLFCAAPRCRVSPDRRRKLLAGMRQCAAEIVSAMTPAR